MKGEGETPLVFLIPSPIGARDRTVPFRLPPPSWGRAGRGCCREPEGERFLTDGTPAEPTLYDRLGGEPGLAAYVDRFYEIMQSDPEAAGIWAMHRRGLDELKRRLVAFLSGFVGGPVVYPQKYGAPMMRARHLPFPIGVAERDAWLRCAYQALAATFTDRAAALQFANGLTKFADHMRNTDPPRPAA